MSEFICSNDFSRHCILLSVILGYTIELKTHIGLNKVPHKATKHLFVGTNTLY